MSTSYDKVEPHYQRASQKGCFEREDAICSDFLHTITKQYINRKHSSTKLIPIEASLKTNDGFIYHNLLDKRKKMKPKFKIYNLIRTAD